MPGRITARGYQDDGDRDTVQSVSAGLQHADTALPPWRQLVSVALDAGARLQTLPGEMTGEHSAGEALSDMPGMGEGAVQHDLVP